MRSSARVIASTLGFSLALTACGGQNASLPWSAGSGNGVAPESSVRNASADKPLIAIPRLSGELAYTDIGRRPASSPVRISITLRYNHQAELDRFVAMISAPHAHSLHFLTRREFEARYAPTLSQEERVVQALRRAGFTIVQRFPNRTIIDATGRSAVVERFFSTEIHNVHQGKYGERYTNLAPATVPGDIAPLVRDVSLNNLIVVRTVADQTGGARTAPQVQRDGQGHVIIPLGLGVVRRATRAATWSTATSPPVRSVRDGSTRATTVTPCRLRPYKPIRARTRRSWALFSRPRSTAGKRSRNS